MGIFGKDLVSNGRRIFFQFVHIFKKNFFFHFFRLYSSCLFIFACQLRVFLMSLSASHHFAILLAILGSSFNVPLDSFFTDINVVRELLISLSSVASFGGHQVIRKQKILSFALCRTLSENLGYKHFWPQFRAIPDRSLISSNVLRNFACTYRNALETIVESLHSGEIP